LVQPYVGRFSEPCFVDFISTGLTDGPDSDSTRFRSYVLTNRHFQRFLKTGIFTPIPAAFTALAPTDLINHFKLKPPARVCRRSHNLRPANDSKFKSALRHYLRLDHFKDSDLITLSSSQSTRSRVRRSGNEPTKLWCGTRIHLLSRSGEIKARQGG
jgi:hypothetical protein